MKWMCVPVYDPNPMSVKIPSHPVRRQLDFWFKTIEGLIKDFLIRIKALFLD